MIGSREYQVYEILDVTLKDVLVILKGFKHIDDGRVGWLHKTRKFRCAYNEIPCACSQRTDLLIKVE